MSPDTATTPALTVVDQPDLVEHLTPRELEVLGLVARGMDNTTICRTLWIGDKTLERHIQQIFSKLELPVACGRHRRVSAVLAYLRSPLARPELQRIDTAGPGSPRYRAR
jgi:DNA-binding NarL/FixJ family response regulator